MSSPAEIGLLDDRPEGNDARLWGGLTTLSNDLATLLPSLPSTSPILLNGSWGSGKTTLLRAVERRLVQPTDTDQKEHPVVWFDAWRYEREAGLLPALVRTVWEAAPAREEVEKQDFFDPLWRSAVALGLRAAPAAATLAGVGFLTPLLKALSPAAVQKDLDALPSPVPQVDETEQLRARFGKLVHKYWHEQPVTILIDDLDRCSPQGAVTLLEGIRLLLIDAQDTPCRFVVALDKGILVQAVSHHFEGIEGFDGNRYLEKIFPLSFEVPIPDPFAVGDLMEHFLRIDGSEPSGNNQRAALSEALRDPLFANPRLMKRCVNRLRLVTYFEHRADDRAQSESNADDHALARWLAAIERWPALRALLQQRGDDDAFWQSVVEASAGAHSQARVKALDPEVHALLAEEGIRPWIRNASERDGWFGELRHADRRMQRRGL